MSNRVYVPVAIFSVPIVGMRNLWEPSTSYRGQATQKPNYLTSVIVKKTQGHWSQEPVLAGFANACKELYAKAMSHIPWEQVVWPLKDGDIASEPGKQPAEWMRGHWYLAGSSSSPINVEIVQGGRPVKLANRAQVKPGDLVALSGALAVKQNDPRGVKLYANNIVFMAPGEEIAVGNGVTGAELMEQAKAQGLNVTGFTPGHQGFGATPPGNGGGFAAPSNGGFVAPSPAQPPQGGFSAPSGFAPPR